MQSIYTNSNKDYLSCLLISLKLLLHQTKNEFTTLLILKSCKLSAVLSDVNLNILLRWIIGFYSAEIQIETQKISIIRQ